MNWLNKWLSELPSVNFKIAVATLMFVGFCLTVFVCMVLEKPLEEGMVLAVGGVILAFAGVTSYDFRTKRTTEILVPPETMASNAASVTTAQAADVAQPVAQPVVPPVVPEGVMAPVVFRPVPGDPAPADVPVGLSGRPKRVRRTRRDAVPPVAPRATPLPDAVPPAPTRDD